MGQMKVTSGFLAAGFLVVSIGPAWSQTCSGKALNVASMQTLLTNRYACADLSPTEHWNELHTGGRVLDYKKGPTDPVDPSDTRTHPTGTYAILDGNGTGGTLTYTYGALQLSYKVLNNGTGTGTNPGTYSFCGIPPAPNLLVTISDSHC